MTSWRRVFVALIAVWGIAIPQMAHAAGRILVMPFENVTRDNRIVWLGEAASVLLADRLNAVDAGAIDRDERQEAFAQLQIPPSASLTDATVIRIGQLVGASQVVVGTLQLDGEALVVQARAIVLETGRVQTRVTERGAMADLFAVFARVAQHLAPDAKASTDSGAVQPSVAAFENYIKGLLAETPATALSYLNAALRAQPAFDRARLAIWEVHDEQGEHAQALAAVQRIPERSAFFRRAQFLTGLSQLNLQRNDDAFETFKALADARATPAVLNNLGVIQLRRGGTPQSGMATYYFNQAADADTTEPDYFFNLGYAYWTAHDVPAATYWLREAVRRNATDGDAHYVLGAALAAAGSTVEANREKELARRLSSTYAEWEKRPGTDVIPKGLERVKRGVELPRLVRVEETLASTGQRDQQELARFYLDRGRRLYQQEHDREALAELSRALFLSPYQADAHLLVGRIHLRAGRSREAIDALKISLWSAESPEAHATLAAAYAETREYELARTEATRALALDPASAAAKRVLETLPPR
jgi:tetratricopeptide (TPR) repeat protein